MSAKHLMWLPPGWRMVRLGDVAEQCLGKMLDAKKNKGSPFAYLRNPNVRWFHVDTSDLQEMPFEEHELDRYGLREGDVLVCEGGEAGRAAIWDGRLPNVKFQKALHRVRPGPDLFNRYLVHRLMADYHSGHLAEYYTGATIKHLTGQDLARFAFPLPPLAEQRRIAEVLDRAESLRTKRRATIAQIDALIQSLFFELIGSSESHDWPEVDIASLAAKRPNAIRTGPFGSQLLHSEFVESGVAVLGIDNVVQNQFVWAHPRFITEQKYRQLERYTVRPGDVLITIMGTCGRCAVVPDGVPIAINTKHLCCITLDHARCIPVYLQACFLLHPKIQERLGARERGAVMPGLNMQIIKELRVPLPSIELQHEFARHVLAAEKLRIANRASLAEMDALFASLQHRAFRGEL